MSIWNWIASTPEIMDDCAEIRAAIKLLQTIQKKKATERQLAEIAKNSCDLVGLISDARTRAGIISQIPSQASDSYPAIRNAISLHYAIGSREPSQTELKEIIECLGESYERCSEDREKVELISETPEPQYSLYEYQRVVLDKTFGLLNSSRKRFLIHMPTGTGKTRTAMAILSLWINQNRGKVMWATYSRELVDQAKNEFLKCWERTGLKRAKIGYFTGDRDSLGEEFDICFASLSKLGRAGRSYSTEDFKRLSEQFSLVIIDEAHQAIAQSYGEAIDRMSQNNPSLRVIGLTATPGRTSQGESKEDIEMSLFFRREKVELEVKGFSSPIEYLVSNGYLSEPEYVEVDPDSFLGKVNSQMVVELTIEAIDNGHKRLIAFAESVSEGKIASATLTALGYEAYFIDGGTPMNERNKIYSIYRSERDTPIAIINWGVLTTGFDAPKTSAVLITRPINSLIVYSQIVGRALRGVAAGGTRTASIYNVYKKDEDRFSNLVKAFVNWNNAWRNQ